MTDGEATTTSFDAAGTELYGLDLAQFIPARDDVVRTLKAAGDDASARQVKALKKPSLAAWALNQLVREDRVQVDALLALGGELRVAQTSLAGDELRALTGQRVRVVRALAHRTADIAAAAGHLLSNTVFDQVARSLDAALTDPDAAAALIEGHLVTDLSYAGLGDTGAALSHPPLTVVRTTAEGSNSRAAHRKRLQAAEQAAAVAATGLETAEESLVRAREAADAANLRAAAAQETLTAAQAELDDATKSEQVAERALALADQTFDRAGARLADAHARLEDLRR